MNNSKFKTKVFILTLLAAQFFLLNVNAQFIGNEPVVIGWENDSLFLVGLTDVDGRESVMSVNVKNGRSVVSSMPVSQYEELAESLSHQETISRRDIIDNNYQSVVKTRDNDLFLIRRGESGFRRLTNDPQIEVNVRFSPDGGKLAYTKDKDLFVFDIDTHKEVRLTYDASDKISNGYASWVYMEEILGRTSNYAAFWWSPDGSKIAFLRSDESDIPDFVLNRLDQPDGLHGTLEVGAYPKAGDPTPKVKMGIADVKTGETIWADIDYSIDQYIAWPFWTQRGNLSRF